MCFSDFPMPENLPSYPHHQQIVRYYNDYAHHFRVIPCIKFHSQVISISPNAEDPTRWDVKWIHCKDGKPLYMKKIQDLQEKEQSFTETFDAVFVSNGHHSQPRWPPPFPGQDTFKGHIIHSHSYKDPLSPYDFRETRAVVVGIGNSAVDIATELSRFCRQVYLSTRTGAWVLPKFISGLPLDHFFGKTTGRLVVMLLPKRIRLSDWSIRQIENTIVTHTGSMESWGLDPGCRMHQTHVTMSQELLSRIGTGTIRVRPQISSFSENSITFVDGTTVKSDAVVFCTGYSIKFPFLAPHHAPVGSDNEMSDDLYKFVFMANLPPTLAFQGLLQPLGAIMPMAEMQARWIVGVWKGELGLPSTDEMRKENRERKEEMAKRFLKRSRHTIQADFQDYMDDIASLIGCLPSIFSNLSLFRELLFGPIWPPQYRLTGPGRWSGAGDAMKKAFHQLYHERPEKEASVDWLEAELARLDRLPK